LRPAGPASDRRVGSRPASFRAVPPGGRGPLRADDVGDARHSWLRLGGRMSRMRRGLDAQSSLRIADAALRMARSTPRRARARATCDRAWRSARRSPAGLQAVSISPRLQLCSAADRAAYRRAQAPGRRPSLHPAADERSGVRLDQRVHRRLGDRRHRALRVAGRALRLVVVAWTTPLVDVGRSRAGVCCSSSVQSSRGLSVAVCSRAASARTSGKLAPRKFAQRSSLCAASLPLPACAHSSVAQSSRSTTMAAISWRSNGSSGLC
jgi:hypothetical protein